MHAIGTKFLGGWAIPKSRSTEVEHFLNQTRAQFDDLVQEFLTNYHANIYEWVSHFQEWENVIRNAVPEEDEIKRRFSFSWQGYEVQASQSVATEGLVEEIADLPNRVLDDIQALAEESWEKTFSNKNEITRKSLRPLRRMEQKLRGMAFLDPMLYPSQSPQIGACIRTYF